MDSTNSTLTFNVTVAPSFADDDTVTVYRVSFNATANGMVEPQVTKQQYGTVRAGPCGFSRPSYGWHSCLLLRAHEGSAHD